MTTVYVWCIPLFCPISYQPCPLLLPTRIAPNVISLLLARTLKTQTVYYNSYSRIHLLLSLSLSDIHCILLSPLQKTLQFLTIPSAHLTTITTSFPNVKKKLLPHHHTTPYLLRRGEPMQCLRIKQQSQMSTMIIFFPTPVSLLHRIYMYSGRLMSRIAPYTYKPIQSVSHHPLTTNSQLAAALGPDNISYTTEIATIPCAGVRISHGPLTGLLAWRLIVCNPSPIKPPKRSWWGSGDGTREEGGNRPGTRAPIFPMHTAVRNSSVWSAASATSLPMKGGSGSHVSLTEGYNVTVERPQSAMTVFGFPRYHEAEHAYTRQASQSEIATATIPVVATNFILDTSLPYSIISRDTLTALGYSPAHFPSSKTDPHAVEYNTTEENRHSELIVSLSIQGVTTRVRVGRPGEASRLGVQYLRDASISVFFPRDGDGVGPVLYCEYCPDPYTLHFQASIGTTI